MENLGMIILILFVPAVAAAFVTILRENAEPKK